MSQDVDSQDLKQIGQYEIRGKIAEGGFGVVYTGHDPRLDREVAIKVLHSYHASEPSRVARFVREARSAAKLNHPGIVQIYDVVEEGGRMALVMELVRGVSLDKYLKAHPDLPLEAKLEIAAQIADTLAVAHEAGIIHRDVKPANVIMDETGHPKLTDFNLARITDYSLTPLTGENSVLGTPAYMSPEQCQGHDAVPQSDLYSLGIMVYEMAAGNVPFEAENYLALLRHHTDTPPTPIRLMKPSLPIALEQLVMRCLAKSIEERPATGHELAQALREMVRLGFNEGDRSTMKTVELPLPPPDMSVSGVRVPLSGERSGEHDSGDIWRSSGQRSLPAKPARRLRVDPWALVACGAGVVAVLAIVVMVAVMRSRSTEPLSRSVSALWSDTPILDYVNEPDTNFAYHLYGTIPGIGYSTHVLDLTSQSWHPGQTDPPLWRHWLTIIAPDKVTSNTAMLVLSDGFSTAEKPLTDVPAIFLAMALTTKSVVAIMEGHPRDPLTFRDGTYLTPGAEREEFAVETFVRFLDTGDPTWPVVCPLVKSVVRAMDAVQAYADEGLGIARPVEHFLLTGDADGWGTWLTAAVDDRVTALAPIQFDLLNIPAQIEHQIGFRGDFSPFLSLFSERGVMPALDTEEGERLLKIIDPYEYRSQLTMPKLLLLPGRTNPYTTIDAAGLYLPDLKGSTYLFCAPNLALTRSNPFLAQRGTLLDVPGAPGGADYARQDFRDTLQVFYHKILVDKPMPRFTWEFSPDGAFRIVAEDQPVEVRLWLAKSDSRDFSFVAEGDEQTVADETAELTDFDGFEVDAENQAWHVETLNYTSEGVYEGKVLLDETKYTAFYIELIYPSILGVNYSLTTSAHVLTAPETHTQITEPIEPPRVPMTGPYRSNAPDLGLD
ncbi:MAG: protein kinase [Nitrospiraceae bacterium]|nr:protein kinase [Nitrospiraceae bacterium]